jgi:hypothetical protein
MSVRERVDDAVCLWKNGRQYGALLCLLVAVAATSRKRYPKPPPGKKGEDERKGTGPVRLYPGEYAKSDRVAFESFLYDEMFTLTGKKMKYGVAFPFRGKPSVPYETILYEFLRCPLVHEADVKGFFFTPSVIENGKVLHQLKLTDPFGIPEQWVWNLAEAVSSVPENKGMFDDVTNPFA